MKHRLLHVARMALGLLILGLSGQALAGEAYPGQTWDRAASPESLGFSGEKLRAADAVARAMQTDAYLVVQGGVIVHEFGDCARPRNIHSQRKSVLSMLMGMAVARGQVDLDKTLAALDVSDVSGLSDTERTATVRQLLMARSGVYHPAAYETAEMAAARPRRHSFAPGEQWYYNNWDFNALGTIFAQCTKKTVFEALHDDLAAPLRFEDFDPARDTRFQYEAASLHPAYVMRLSARDVARLGLLMARGGQWQGRRILSPQWMAESTTAYSTDQSGNGYGYLWWVGVNGRLLRTDFPGPVFAARGHRGQYLVVDPGRDLVIVHQTDTEAPGDRRVSARQFAELLRRILEAYEPRG